MLRRTYVMNNPIWTCDELEDVITGIKLQKMTPADNFKSLTIQYILVDDENNYSIPEEVYDTILKLMNK